MTRGHSLTWNLLVKGTAWQLYFSISVHSVPPSSSPPSTPTFPCFFFIIYSHCESLRGICSCVSLVFSLPGPPWLSLSRVFTKCWNRSVAESIWSALDLFCLLLEGFEAKKHPNVRLLQTGGLTRLAVALVSWHGVRSLDNGGL